VLSFKVLASVHCDIKKEWNHKSGKEHVVFKDFNVLLLPVFEVLTPVLMKVQAGLGSN
jgi:hypothetical protein